MVAESEVSAVLAEYRPENKKYAAYQSEAELEHELIQSLQEQGYDSSMRISSVILKALPRNTLEQSNE